MSMSDIVRSARALVGVPYVVGGRSSKGLDCAGLIIVVGNALQLQIPVPPTDYSRAILREDYVIDQMDRNFDKRSQFTAQPGMVLVVKPRASLTHLAILDTMRTMIEAVNDPGVMSVTKRQVDWSKVRGVYAYRVAN